jgi:hypothetical protein
MGFTELLKELDWKVIGAALAFVVGGGGAGSGVTLLVQRRWATKDRKHEREEHHRKHLLQLYVAMLDACAKSHESGEVLAQRLLVAEHRRQLLNGMPAPSKVGIVDSSERERRQIAYHRAETAVDSAELSFASSWSEAHTKINFVLMHETVSSIIAALTSLRDCQVRRPQGAEDAQGFVEDQQARRRLVNDVVTAAQGRFSPGAWDAERKRLTSPTTAALPAAPQLALPPSTQAE